MSGRRTFDYDHCQWLKSQGWTYQQLADHFNVSHFAIWRALQTDERRAERNRAQERYRTPCVDCGTPVYGRYKDTKRCVPCSASARTTTVRDTELKCSTCQEWKPDTAFPMGRNSAKLRRGRHSQCTVCQTEQKRRYRARVSVPCASCGKPRLPKSQKSAGAKREHLNDSGLCAACYTQSVRRAA